MRLRNLRGRPAPGAVAALALGLLLAGSGCELDESANPDLTGPAEEGISVQLLAFPDILNADGVSTSVVRLVLRDQTGAAIGGRSVHFVLESGDGLLDPGSGATYVGPIQFGLVMATNSNGETNVVYTAGTGIGVVRISVRPYGIDAAQGFYRSVDIFQQ